jgi:hypothetical protein
MPLGAGDQRIKQRRGLAGADLDGIVGTSDLNLVLTNYGQNGPWSMGDFDGDGIIGTSDLSLLLTNYGQSVGSSAPLNLPKASAPNLGPMIDGIVVAPTRGLITWNAQDADGVASSVLKIDGSKVSRSYGPYLAASGVNFAGVFGSLSAGAHNYTITTTDKLGNSLQRTGTFEVKGPTIGGIVVVPSQGLMTWNAQDADGVAEAVLLVDGTTVPKVYGPYVAATGVNYSGVFGTLLTGAHNYTITATDNLGNPSRMTGAFDVAAANGPIIGSLVVLVEKGLMTWNAQDVDGLASANRAIDGSTVSKVYGPYASSSGVNYSGVFGNLLSGSHTYTITATDKAGNSSTSTGTFSVPAASKSAVGVRSLATNAVLGALATKASTSAKMDWLYDDMVMGPKESTNKAVDAALASF